MPAFVRLSPDFAVAGELSPADLKAAADAGFRTVINNRREGEDRLQTPLAAARAAAAELGLTYRHVPASKSDLLTDEVVGATAGIMAESTGPVLAHCKSGQRSAIIWAAAMARTTPVSEVIATLAQAGFDLGFLRDDLEAQADRARWQSPASVDAPAASEREAKRAAA